MASTLEYTNRRERSIGNDEIRLAGFFVRLFARILDVIVIVAIINVLFYIDNLGGNRGWWPPMPIPGDTLSSSTSFFDIANIIRTIFYVGIHPLYYILLHAMGGQTLGKMAFRIKVVTLNGEDITMVQSTLRWLGYLLCDITLGIGYLVIVFSRSKQGLHDKIAGTKVFFLR